MNDIADVMIILIGVAVRLVIPILITIIAVYFLRKLDANWQAEGRKAPNKVEKPACWEIMGCTPDQRKDCPGYKSPLPCWQARRTSNGYLREECLGCKVFQKAPLVSIG
jgi:hypothetical protein